MKMYISLFSLLLPLLFIGCSKDDNNNSNPIGGGLGTGGGGTGTGSVTFTIGSQQGQGGGTEFFASPSVNVKITQVNISLPAQQFTDMVQGDGTTVFQANQPVIISNEYNGVQSGQQWTFQFQGTLESNNQAFNVTSNYTVP